MCLCPVSPSRKLGGIFLTPRMARGWDAIFILDLLLQTERITMKRGVREKLNQKFGKIRKASQNSKVLGQGEAATSQSKEKGKRVWNNVLNRKVLGQWFWVITEMSSPFWVHHISVLISRGASASSSVKWRRENMYLPRLPWKLRETMSVVILSTYCESFSFVRHLINCLCLKCVHWIHE